MRYCHKCLQPDTRPGIKFDANGICPACNYYGTLKEIDWDERKKELDSIVTFGKVNNKSGYDCIIGVSGGKDSTRQSLYVRETLNMKPLIVCLSYPPEQLSQRGADNISNLISHGFDCIVIQPSPVVWRKLMKKGFDEYSNFLKSTELALFSSVPRLAIAYQIPLIWWGENAALQLGDLNVMGKTGSDGNNLRKMNTLGGGEITWLISEEVKKNQILQYCYPSEKEMNDANLRITFLGYFMKDWSLLNNSVFSMLRGLEVRSNSPFEIGDLLPSNALDEDWSNVNQMIKYLKFGFGRTTDVVNEEIRIGRMTREEGIRIVKLFDGKCSEDLIKSFCDYIDISKSDFWDHIDKIVNPFLFERQTKNQWIPKFEIGKGL
jgi:N-acetyl sugar amidotransferase